MIAGLSALNAKTAMTNTVSAIVIQPDKGEK